MVYHRRNIYIQTYIHIYIIQRNIHRAEVNAEVPAPKNRIHRQLTRPKSRPHVSWNYFQSFIPRQIRLGWNHNRRTAVREADVSWCNGG